jgi:hypothetical protein
MMIGYSESLKPSKKNATAAKKAGKPIRMVLKEALSRKWRHLATERIEDVRPKIPLGRKFWALSKAEHDEIKKLFESKNAKSLVSFCLQANFPAAEHWRKFFPRNRLEGDDPILRCA